MKQMIEIDVPDGYAYTGIDYGHSRWTEEGECIEVTLFLMKKEPKYIEVRDYLALDFRGKPIKMTLNADDFEWVERLELYPDFIRWIDKEPRKVAI